MGKLYILTCKSTNRIIQKIKKESRGVPLMNKLSLQSVNMGGALSNSAAFFSCTLKIEL